MLQGTRPSWQTYKDWLPLMCWVCTAIGRVVLAVQAGVLYHQYHCDCREAWL